MTDDPTRIRYGLMTPEGFVEQPHWEYSHRTHGYWLGEQPLGLVSISPDGTYRWWLHEGVPILKGQSRTLRTAKRRVKKAVEAARKPRTPETASTAAQLGSAPPTASQPAREPQAWR